MEVICVGTILAMEVPTEGSDLFQTVVEEKCE